MAKKKLQQSKDEFFAKIYLPAKCSCLVLYFAQKLVAAQLLPQCSVNIDKEV